MIYIAKVLVLGGHENDVFVVVSGEMEETICMPGTSVMTTHTTIRFLIISFLFSSRSYSPNSVGRDWLCIKIRAVIIGVWDYKLTVLLLFISLTLIFYREDLPTDLVMKMDLQKETPFPMHVPCLDGIGSCEYDLCAILNDQPPSICNALPPTQPCGCPLLKVYKALSFQSSL